MQKFLARAVSLGFAAQLGFSGLALADVNTASTTSSPSAAQTQNHATPDTSKTEEKWLVRGSLFDPLIADPKWAHFSASFQSYGGEGGEVDWAGSVSFGDSLSFYEGPAGGNSRWGIGIQAAVFALFDMDSDSHDLINADYWIGIPLTYKNGPWQAIGRIYHQSSHLGDEYLLRAETNQDDRVNLSFEVIDLKISRYFYGDAIRIYGGAGYIFHREPADLEPWLTQAGFELRSPYRFINDSARPIFGLDVHKNQESDWDVDYSARVGIEFLGNQSSDFTLQLLLEYYNGRSPHGQFYDNKIDYWGLGLHAFF